MTDMNHNVFERIESNVRSYCRSFPRVFEKGRGAYLIDETGDEYIDFFSGAGTLNYGHNNPGIKKAVIEYLERDGVVHGLDMWTVAKRTFLETFERIILKPRHMDYKVQFTGPTGANAVEAALKLAKKVKKRSNIIAFTNGYHGLSAGALAVTGNRHFRTEEFVQRQNVSFMPFDGYFGDSVNTLEYVKRFLGDNSSGVDIPAAMIVETVQAEGGINVARAEWLQGLESICREFDILLIVDDIQVGNGRTGTYFSFERSEIQPDMIVVSKAIGGLGLPMSMVLIKPNIDQWKPAEHTGTFRGLNLAFVAAAAALTYWEDGRFTDEIMRKETILSTLLHKIKADYHRLSMKVRGVGLIYGIEMPRPEIAKEIVREAFQRKLIIELAGPEDQVIKFLPPLVVEETVLEKGVKIIEDSIKAVCTLRGY